MIVDRDQFAVGYDCTIDAQFDQIAQRCIQHEILTWLQRQQIFHGYSGNAKDGFYGNRHTVEHRRRNSLRLDGLVGSIRHGNGYAFSQCERIG